MKAHDMAPVAWAAIVASALWCKVSRSILKTMLGAPETKSAGRKWLKNPGPSGFQRSDRVVIYIRTMSDRLCCQRA